MPLVDIDPQLLPRLKLGVHSAQILLSFVAWCLEIAVFSAKDAKVTGQNGWTFGVCFLSAPAWVYLIMTPRFERTRRFAQPHAMLMVDVLFTVLWLSAFATQAAYNSANKCGQACNLSKAIVAMGVLNTILFAVSSFLSGFTLQYYNFHGTLPGYDARQLRTGDNIDPDKAAFSMAPHDDEAYERVNMDDRDHDHDATNSAYAGDRYDHSTVNSSYGADRYGSNYGSSNPYNPTADDDDRSQYSAHPSRNNTLFDSDTQYNPGGAPSQPYQASHGAHGAYDDGPAQFPTADYDRVPALNRL